MIQNLNFLPQNIVDYIIPYTYSPQSNDLLEDIRSFVETKQTICSIYRIRWDIFDYLELNEDKNWLINDISIQLNEDQPSMYDYSDYNRSVFSRHFRLKNYAKNKLDEFILKTIFENVDWQINFIWGLMNPLERDAFISVQEIKFVS